MTTTNSNITFLPHLRQGLAGSLTTPDTLGTGTSTVIERGDVTINFDLKVTPVSGAEQTLPQSKTIQLTGPGDIIGINSNAIVKVCPQDWETNFESNLIPFVEFYDEDFPWRYTPAAPKATNTSATHLNDRLRPWITLVVLKESEFTLDTQFNGVLPSFTLTSGTDTADCFPDPTQTWAWAHVQVNQDLGQNPITVTVNDMLTDLQNTLSTTPDKAFSRLLCGRRLEKNTAYRAFIIPTFNTGRLAGLNQAATIPNGFDDALEPAWGNSSNPTVFPYYYNWYFKTGAGGDFEALARLLKPAVPAADIGKRMLDVQRPGLPSLDLTAETPTIGLEGIVKPAGMVSDNWDLPNSSNGFNFRIVELLNKTEQYAQQGNADPVIVPPIYGRWHAEQKQVNLSDSDWLHRVNIDPRYRLFAGLGAEVIRKHQDEFMAIAWSQIGDVIEANRLLNLLQLAQETAQSLHRRNIAGQPEELVLTLTGNTHARVLDPNSSPAATVYKQIRDSIVPNAVFSAAFRRISSPNGLFSRMIDNAATQAFRNYSLLTNINAMTVTGAPVYAYPVGQISYTVLTPSQLTPTFTQSQPARANFSLTNPSTSPLSVTSSGSDSAQANAFRGAAAAFHNYIASIQGPQSPAPALDVTSATTVMQDALMADVVYNALASQISVTTPDGIVTPRNTTDVVMAAPAIRRAMYRYLIEQSPDWMLPNLNALRQNSVTIFEANQAKIEAYMLGLNHEFARELLWRGYPTDQRGTYFHHFWEFANSTKLASSANDFTPLQDIKPIHQWKIGNHFSDLGTNSGRTTTPDLLIVAIRGDLLRKYPTAMISMQRAKWKTVPDGPEDADTDPDPLFDSPRELDYSLNVNTKVPLFTAKAEPDILFFGFDISLEDARGANDIYKPGWFFVLQERMGEIRFGLDELTQVGASTTIQSGGWNGLEWGHFVTNQQNLYPFINTNTLFTLVGLPAQVNPETVSWGSNAADIAYALMQLPVRLALHSKDLLPEPTN